MTSHRFNRRIPFILLVLFLAICLTACSTNTTPAQTDADPVQTAAVPASTSGDSTGSGLVNETGVLPIVNEPIEMTVLCPASAVIEDWNTNKMTLHLEERTGIALDMVSITEAEYTQKLTLMVSAGGNDLGDILISGGFAQTYLTEWAKAGAILPLNDYYEPHAY